LTCDFLRGRANALLLYQWSNELNGKLGLAAVLCLSGLSACVDANAASDACGASDFQYLVGGPSSATWKLPIPESSRHYGSKEEVAKDKPRRLNIVHSGTATEAVTNPDSKVIAVVCG